MTPLTNPEIRKLKARAQLLEPMLKVGKAGLSDGFIKSVADALAIHKLVKVKFVEFKEEKKSLSIVLAEKTASHLIMRVGNVAVLYRADPGP
jgi:RNA-binding protein